MAVPICLLTILADFLHRRFAEVRRMLTLCIINNIAAMSGAEDVSLLHLSMIEKEIAYISRCDVRIVLQMRMECCLAFI